MLNTEVEAAQPNLPPERDVLDTCSHLLLFYFFAIQYCLSFISFY